MHHLFMKCLLKKEFWDGKNMSWNLLRDAMTMS